MNEFPDEVLELGLAELPLPEEQMDRLLLLSEHVRDLEVPNLMTQNWQTNRPVNTANTEIIVEPFKICKISNFFANEQWLEELKGELRLVQSQRSVSDLYSHEHTDDLKAVQSQRVKLLCDLFQDDIRSWLIRNTLIKLNSRVSISSSRYKDTDHLLCHDDNSEDRRIAFILYLTKDWTEDDGGALDLIETDDRGMPRDVAMSLVPEYNSLVFFEVVDNSYHQVAEVLTWRKDRWSIFGWFHGELRQSNRQPRPERQIVYYQPLYGTGFNLEQWVSRAYLENSFITEFQLRVESDSFGLLKNFLIEDVYNNLSMEMASDEIVWRRVGPLDERNYEVADVSSLPLRLKGFFSLFKSLYMFDLLKKYTHLDLVSKNEKMKPRMSVELQRWSQGCYTLLGEARHKKNDSGKQASGSRPNNSDDESSDSESFKGDSETVVKNSKAASDKRKIGESMDDERLEADSDKRSIDECSSSGLIAVSPAKRRRKSSKKNQKQRSDESGTTYYLSPVREDSETEGDERKVGGASTDTQHSEADSSDKRTNDESSSAQSELQQEGRELEKQAFEESDKSEFMMWRAKFRRESLELESPTYAETYMADYTLWRSQFRRESVEFERQGSEVSGMTDYMSSPEDKKLYDRESDEASGDETEDEEEPGVLDVIIQFHTENDRTRQSTIDYVDPEDVNGQLVSLDINDNQLCLVYYETNIKRLHRYVNHYCSGYFYNFICTYHE